MPKVTKIERGAARPPARKRVAAYCRVSIDKGRTMHSLSAQVSHYNRLIQQDPAWVFAGVYSDGGATGTKADRPGFQELMRDCEDGRIDVVLTKSISRFARNTVDLLESVRRLKELGVEVRFEKEGISSLSADGEVMLTLLASFAQEEVTSLSNNAKWAVQKRFEQGIPNGQMRVFGYEWVDGELVVVPSEAEVVRRIFQNFLDGKSRLETERELNAEGVTTKRGYAWQDSSIKVVLTNVTYTGDLLLQKEYIADPITKKRRKNRGELPQYLVESHHEAIIDRETFDFVQEEMARRRELGALANKSLNVCCFTGKVKCPHCGVSYMHNRRKDRGGSEFWCCGEKKKRDSKCPLKGNVPHHILVSESAAALGLDEFDEAEFLRRVERIEVPQEHVLVFRMADDEVVERRWESTAKRDMWTPERKEIWSLYLRDGASGGTGMGFNEYAASKGVAL